MKSLGDVEVPETWHVRSLPYIPAQDRLTEHITACAQCAQAQFTVAEDLPREPMCPEGTGLLYALADARLAQQKQARAN